MLLRGLEKDYDVLSGLRKDEIDVSLIPIYREKEAVGQGVVVWGERFRDDYRYLKNNRRLNTHRSGEVVLKYIEIKIRQKYNIFDELNEPMKKSIYKLYELLGARRNLAEFLTKFWNFLEIPPKEKVPKRETE